MGDNSFSFTKEEANQPFFTFDNPIADGEHEAFIYSVQPKLTKPKEGEAQKKMLELTIAVPGAESLIKFWAVPGQGSLRQFISAFCPEAQDTGGELEDVTDLKGQKCRVLIAQEAKKAKAGCPGEFWPARPRIIKLMAASLTK